MDLPEGVIWRLDARPNREPLKTGLQYGSMPIGTRQGYPSEGQPAQLVDGETYYIYVLVDIGLPITRCLFTYESDNEGGLIENPDVPQGGWNAVCEGNDDCNGDTGFCAKMPGAVEGYCTAHCASTAACAEAGAPSGWTCNAIACDVPDFTWCGPASEISEGGGFLKECQ